MKLSKKDGFTLVELVVVIVIIGILAGIGYPLYHGYLSRAADAQSMLDAKAAYTAFWTEQLAVRPISDSFVYIEDNGKHFSILHGGVLASPHPTTTEAIKSLKDDPDTPENEAQNYRLSATNIEKLYEVVNGSGGSNSEKWSDTSVVFVGDSITAGSGTTKAYHSYLDDMLGFGSITLMGVSGSCISLQSDYASSNSPLINRYTQIPNADFIVIFMGTNDYGHETPLGSPSDTSDVSFYGALDVILSHLTTTHPKSQIIMATPLHRYGFGTSKLTGTQFTYDSLPNGQGHSLADYVGAIKSVCSRYSIPVIDLYTEYYIDPADPIQKTNYMPDGLHPNAAGHEILANIMASHLERYADNSPGTSQGGTPVPPPTVSSTSMQHGNRFASGFENDKTRISSSSNLYLTAGTVVTMKDPTKYQWALAQTSNASSSNNNGYVPDAGWSSKSSCTIDKTGYYGLTIKKNAGTEFNFTNGDSNDLYDYIIIR